jgi:hypothetical protein
MKNNQTISKIKQILPHVNNQKKKNEDFILFYLGCSMSS